MRRYIVQSPTYTYEDTIPGLMCGPRYEVCDVLYVWARNAKRAKVCALRVWRRRQKRHLFYNQYRKVSKPGEWLNWDDHICPFTGMEARRLNSVLVLSSTVDHDTSYDPLSEVPAWV